MYKEYSCDKCNTSLSSHFINHLLHNILTLNNYIPVWVTFHTESDNIVNIMSVMSCFTSYGSCNDYNHNQREKTPHTISTII